MANSKYQKFHIETINRADIKNAEYNPRIMDKEAKKRLKEGLKKHGLVSTLTWNKRTGNLVGGHQRLEQLDALEKNKDYSLDVCVIDVDEKEEAILNVQLNNPSMQGEWDLDKLAGITEQFDVNFDDMGFTKLDVDFMFDGDERFSEMFETPEAEEVKQGLEEVKEARAAGKERMQDKNNINFYAVLVFEDEQQKADFYKKINVPVFEEYLTVDKIMRLADK
ncbi:MAG: hypothetical protein ACI4XP_03165 [Acutalibacteraceae bacterium]